MIVEGGCAGRLRRSWSRKIFWSASFPRYCGLGCDKGKETLTGTTSGPRYDREFKNNAVTLVHAGRTIRWP